MPAILYLELVQFRHDVTVQGVSGGIHGVKRRPFTCHVIIDGCDNDLKLVRCHKRLITSKNDYYCLFLIRTF